MEEFKRIPIEVNEEGLKVAVSNCNTKKDYFQSVIKSIINLHLGVEFDKNDLAYLISNPRNFITSKIVKEPLNIGGMELDKDKVFDFLKLPGALKNIISSIDTSLSPHTKNYFITNDNTVEIVPGYLEALEPQYTVYIETPRQKQAYDAINKIAEGITELNEMKSIYHFERIEKYISFNNGTAKPEYKYLNEFR